MNQNHWHCSRYVSYEHSPSFQTVLIKNNFEIVMAIASNNFPFANPERTAPVGRSLEKTNTRFVLLSLHLISYFFFFFFFFRAFGEKKNHIFENLQSIIAHYSPIQCTPLFSFLNVLHFPLTNKTSHLPKQFEIVFFPVCIHQNNLRSGATYNGK